MSITSQLLKKVIQVGPFQTKVTNFFNGVPCVSLCFFFQFLIFFSKKNYHVSGP